MPINCLNKGIQASYFIHVFEIHYYYHYHSIIFEGLH